MATRLLCQSRTAVLLNSNLRSVAQSIQSFSSGAKFGQGPSDVADEATSAEGPSSTVWPDPNLGLLGPKDKRLPLPGNVGISNDLLSRLETPLKQSAPKEDCDVLTAELPQERHMSVMSQVLNPDQLEDGLDAVDEAEDMPMSLVLECLAQECPQLIRKDFRDLFPGVDIMTGPFSVITLSQKTDNDMTGWSEAVEMEREELMLYFVIAAEEICSHLKSLGYWADFIDPSSGRPYLGPYTSATMFETDERYRHFGFRIEDLGCCKVISHRSWGTNVFIGCLFTNAPADSPHIRAIIERHGSGKKK